MVSTMMRTPHRYKAIAIASRVTLRPMFGRLYGIACIGLHLGHGFFRGTAMTIEKGHTMKISQRVIRFLCLFGLWLGIGLQAHAQTDTVTYVYTDPQGTPLVKADAQGNVIARYDYTPYGNAVTSLGNPPNGPGYTGHVNDPETGLVYMQARYYQPDGRFLSPDPMESSAGNIFSFNRYDYTNNNPIINIDPDGRQSKDDPCMGNMRCIVETPNEEQSMRRIGQEIKPNNVPFGGNESVATIAGRVNGETSGMHDSRNENESLQSAQIKIATVRINGILKWGKAVQAHASLAPPMMSGPGYKSALRAVQTAIAEKMNGIDETFGVDHSRGGALFYNMRTPSQAAGDRSFMGYSPHTISGPYISPSIYTYIFTYGE